MNCSRGFRQVVIAVTALIIISMPFAGARPLDTPKAAHSTDGGWLGTALEWLANLTELQRPTAERKEPTGSSKSSDNPKSTTGGSCVDPAGHPRPWCL